MDWFDPDTLTHWGAILAAIVAIAAPIGAILVWFEPLLRWFRTLTKSEAQQESILLRFVPNDQRCHWSVARLNDQPATHVQGRWDVTNTSKSNVMILKARLGKYTTSFADARTHHPEDEREIFGKFPVLSYQMSEISAEFTFFPPIAQGHDPIVNDVIFTDNFANEHRVPTQFRYLGSDEPF